MRLRLHVPAGGITVPVDNPQFDTRRSLKPDYWRSDWSETRLDRLTTFSVRCHGKPMTGYTTYCLRWRGGHVFGRDSRKHANPPGRP